MEIVIKLVEKKFVEIEGAMFEVPTGAKWVAVDLYGAIFAYWDKPYVATILPTWASQRHHDRIGDTHSVHPDWQNMIMEVPE